MHEIRSRCVIEALLVAFPLLGAASVSLCRGHRPAGVQTDRCSAILDKNHQLASRQPTKPPTKQPTNPPTTHPTNTRTKSQTSALPSNELTNRTKPTNQPTNQPNPTNQPKPNQGPYHTKAAVLGVRFCGLLTNQPGRPSHQANQLNQAD